MSIVRITPTQFTAKPSNRPASTELAYGKTQGITSNFKTQHQQDSMYGFFSHFSENSKTTRKLFQASIKVNRTIIFLKFQTVITSLMQIFIFETRVLSTKTQNNLYITRIYPPKELYHSCLSDFFYVMSDRNLRHMELHNFSNRTS